MKLKQQKYLFIVLIFCIFTVLLTLSIVIVEELYFEKRAETVALDNALNKAKERETVVQNFLNNSEQTLSSLRTTDAFNSFLYNGSHKDTVEALCLILASSNTPIKTIRFVDANGFEQMRIERNTEDANPTIVDTEPLQYPSDAYFLEASHQKPTDQVWFSKIDLEENSIINPPYKPIIRAVMPVNNEKTFAGFLMITYSAEKFLNQLTNTPLYDMILYDDAGYIIYHYEHKLGNHTYCFGNVLDTKEATIASLYSEDYKQIQASTTYVSDSYTARHFAVPIEGGLNLILKFSESYLENELAETKRHYTSVFVIVLLFSIFLSLLMTRFFRKTLLNINALEALNNNYLKAEEALKTEKAKYKNILELSSDGIFLMDLNGNLIEHSRKAMELLGYTPEEMLTLKVKDWDKEITDELWAAMLKNLRNEPIEIERIHTKKDGSTYVAYITANLLEFDNEIHIYSSARDITAMKQIQKELEDSTTLWKFAVEGNKDGLWDWNINTNKVFYSPQWKKMLGYEPDEIGDSLEEWRIRVHPDDIDMVYQKMGAYSTGASDHYTSEHRFKKKDGTYLWVRDRGIIIERNDDGTPRRLIGTHTDITEYKKAMQIIKDQTYIDELTKLHNRKAYNERVSELLEQYHRYNVTFSMMMMDIDHFKSINDTYGHSQGDAVLVEIGKVLRNCSRKNDYVFRIGGEEFVLLITGTPLTKAALFAEKVRKSIESDVTLLKVHNRDVTVSIGVIEINKKDNIDTLYKRADDCLYKAKANGRNTVVTEQTDLQS